MKNAGIANVAKDFWRSLQNNDVSRKIRFNCDHEGSCFLRTLQAPIYMFDGAFVGKNALSDCDGWIERNGHFLFLEWKAPGGKILLSQKILAERLTKRLGDYGIFLFVEGPIHLDPDTELRVTVCRNGKMCQPKEMSYKTLWHKFADWDTKVLDRKR